MLKWVVWLFEKDHKLFAMFMCLCYGTAALPTLAATVPEIQAVLPAKVVHQCKPELLGAFLPKHPEARAGCKPPDIRAALGAQPALVGAGDLVLFIANWQIPAADYKPRVWFNGAEVTEVIKVIGIEHVQNPALVVLTLRLNPGAQSRALWSTLIRNAGLSTSVPLSVSLGTNVEGASPIVGRSVNEIPAIALYTSTIAVTVEWRLWLAFILIILFGGGAFALAIGLNVLKDKAPAVIAEALSLAHRLRRQWKASKDADKCIRDYYKDYHPSTPACATRYSDPIDLECLKAADLALASGQILPPREQVVVGLIEGRREWSYSLAATQLFLWFLFALLSGIYFWAIYGQMPAIDKSILGLLGISAGTAGLAWAVDRSSFQLPGGPSLGFFEDLITDANNEGRVHRFQCVFVNGALLLVGISNIVLDMEYPTFDETWLIFLTISGVTYTAGKKIQEQK